MSKEKEFNYIKGLFKNKKEFTLFLIGEEYGMSFLKIKKITDRGILVYSDSNNRFKESKGDHWIPFTAIKEIIQSKENENEILIKKAI